MDDLKPYPAYQETAIPWLGGVPAHWDVVPLKAIARPKSIRNKEHRELLSVYLNLGVIRFSDIKDKRTNPTSEDLSKYQAVDPGDFVLNNQQAWRGSVGVSKHKGIVSPAYLVLSLDSKIQSKFANLLFRERTMVAQYLISSKGVGSIQRNLYWPYLKQVATFLPPPSEQTAIARYLDWADNRIRRLIRARQKQIKLLEEHKQAIIQQAVTGQIDVKTGQPYPAYKDSGVEWLGHVPEHWEVRQVKRYYHVDLGKMLDSKSQDGKLLPYLNAANIHWRQVLLKQVNTMHFTDKQMNRYLLQRGDLLVTEGGATLGRSAIWQGDLDECYYQNSLNRIRPIKKLPNLFLYYWLFYLIHSGFIESIVGTATFGHLTKEKLSNLELLVPQIDEAVEITKFFDRLSANAERMKHKLNQSIDILQEYRTRLIADVVTGKVDVRQAATHLSDVPEIELDEEPLEDWEEEGELDESEVIEEGQDAE